MSWAAHPLRMLTQTAAARQTARVRISGLDHLGRGVGSECDGICRDPAAAALGSANEAKPSLPSPSAVAAALCRIVVPFALPGELVTVRLPFKPLERPLLIIDWVPHQDEDAPDASPGAGNGGDRAATLHSGETAAADESLSFVTADIVEVLEPSPDRVASRCALFTVCNGCQLQHASIQQQRAWKKRVVTESLLARPALPRRAAALVEDAVGTDAVYGYRTKLTPHHDRPRRPSGDVGPIGFLRAGGHGRAIVDVPECPIATPAINAQLPAVREAARAAARAEAAEAESPTSTGRRRRLNGKTVLLRDSGSGIIETNQKGLVRSTVNGLTFEYLAGEFFQNNASLLPALVDHVVAEARSRGADLLVDCYCGGGLFALSASASFEAVVGVEVSKKNTAAARCNAERNAITNAVFIQGDASQLGDSVAAVLAAHQADYGRRTAVVIDPPRKGCSAEFLAQLGAFGATTIVYVSCDPGSLARDTEALLGLGEYELARVVPFDMFPQTRHVETVATFHKRSSP
eukprot:m.37715 g.37715  ORF g.37715 m.37715 type:complete len:520 (-) comp13176_c0_seq1:182-1741(-)